MSASSLVTASAKHLDVTRAKLKTAIVDSANAYIDSEVTSGDVDAGDAADLKDQVGDDLAFAIAPSRTKTVAANLGITVAAPVGRGAGFDLGSYMGDSLQTHSQQQQRRAFHR